MITGRVSSGDKVRGTLSASTHNTVLDMVQDYRARRGATASGSGLGPYSLVPANAILGFREADAGTLERFSPVVLDWASDNLGAAPEGTDAQPLDPEGWQRRPYVNAISPTSGDSAKPVGIAAEALAARQFGRIFVSGVTLARVNLTNTSHGFASLGSSATALVSSETGPVRLLWTPPDEDGNPFVGDDQLCFVLLHASGSAGTDGGFWARITGVAGDEPDALYSWTKVELVGDDFAEVDPAITGDENLVRVPSNGIPPAIPNGQVVRIWASPTESGMYECPASGGLITVDHTIQTYVWDSGLCILTPTTYTVRTTARDLKLEVI